MKALNPKIEELLKFRPNEGKVLLNGARTLICNADALGNLRNDLIHNLGFERAKGFLLRYGWHLGYNDGKIIKENFDSNSDEEALVAGSILFTMEGFAKVQNHDVKFDRDKKIFIKNGIFINSFEAEQHIRFFGQSDQPVCWLLIGYAGGYGSAISGEKVYYIETKCIGKGDSVCEYEGKTLSQWGSDQFSELRFYEDITIREELEMANKRINEQNSQLERSLNIHEELYQLVLRGEGFSGITEKISELCNDAILFFNNKLKLLSSSKSLDQEILEVLKCKLKKKINENLFSHTNPDLNVTNHIRKIEVKVCSNKLEYYYVVFPIITKDEILGFIAAINKDIRELKQESLILLQRSTDIYAVEVMRQRQMLTLEHQFRADFIESLFNKKYSSLDTLVAWGERLGLHMLDNYYVLALNIIAENSALTYEERLVQKKEIRESINIVLKNKFSSVMCVEFKENIVILLPSLEEKYYIKEIIINTIKDLTHFKCHLLFGIGSVVSQVENYYQSYLQACKALKIIKSFNKKDHILFFDELGSLSVLLDVQTTENLLGFMQNKLKPILDYDKKNNSDLLTTLQQYLYYKNIHKASQVTNLSLSGFKYRLNRIKSFGYDLNSPNEIFDLHLAVRIYRIYQ